ncbi:hypothetical protein AMJ48_00670 [Parcubacteria bacterium DG_74_1]|nr:MAG: hypothetical protein AMJ48_00670 [Parcubacteria bacterium DG_74_1]
MKSFPILFLIILLGGLLLPSVTLAGEYDVIIGGIDTHNVTYDGLVPCGRCLNINPGRTADSLTANYCNASTGVFVDFKYIPCQFCHLFIVLKSIVDFVLLYVVFPIGTLFLIVGGLMFFFSAENPQKAERAKSLLTSVVIGLVLIFSAWLVIGLFFTAIGLSNFALSFTGPDNWFTVDCEVTLDF